MLRHVLAVVIEIDSRTLKSFLRISSKRVESRYFCIESIQCLLPVPQLFVPLFHAWNLNGLLLSIFAFGIFWMLRSEAQWFLTRKQLIIYPANEILWLLLKTREFPRAHRLDSDPFKHSFALPACYDEHALWDFSRSHQRFPKNIGFLLNVENHLEQVEPLS